MIAWPDETWIVPSGRVTIERALEGVSGATSLEL
jgi:hypothetical protein